MNHKISITKSEKIIDILRGYYGNVNPDLKFNGLYELTIAVVLSAQTTDKQVNSVTPKLFSKYRNFKSLAEAELSEVEEIIKSTGFYHAKAKNIIGLSKMVTGKYRGSLPREMDKLLELPGVGRKSANVILSIGYGIPGLAVDTHVGRIAKRLGYTESENPDMIEKDLCAIIPPDRWRDTHLLFIKHGRAICRSRNPECGLCPVKHFCLYRKKNNIT